MSSLNEREDTPPPPPPPPPTDGSNDTSEDKRASLPAPGPGGERPDLAELVTMRENLKNTVVRGYMNTLCSLLGAKSLKREDAEEKRRMELARSVANKWMHKTFVRKKGARVRRIAELNYDKKWRTRAFFKLRGKVKRLKAEAHDAAAVELTDVSPPARAEQQQGQQQAGHPKENQRKEREGGGGFSAVVATTGGAGAGSNKGEKPKRPLVAKREAYRDDDGEELYEEWEEVDESMYTPWFIGVMTVLHVAVFILEVWNNNWSFDPMATNPFFGVDAVTLVDFGAKRRDEVVHDGEGWRLFAALFAHSGVIHVFLTLVFQLRIGIGLERLYGWWRLLPIYFVSGVAGYLGSCVFLPEYLSVGASPSLFGMLGALLVELIQNWKRMESPGTSLAKFLVVIAFSLVVGLLPFVDNYAHIFAFLTGVPLAGIFLPTVTFGKWDVKRKLIIVAVSLVPLVGYFAIMVPLVYAEKDIHSVCSWCTYLNCVPVKDGWCDPGGAELSSVTV